MKLEHIYILNRALDGKDIFSMPSFAALEMSGMTISMYKDAMVEDGLLESHASFTDEGLRVAKAILGFKDAKKYISILDIVFGLIDEEAAVMLERTGKEYRFTVVDTAGAAAQLTGAYGFLSLPCDSWGHGMPVSPEELLQMYNLDSKNSFSLVTEKDGAVTKEIVFTDGEGAFVYDCVEGLLYQKGEGGMKALLEERMAI